MTVHATVDGHMIMIHRSYQGSPGRGTGIVAGIADVRGGRMQWRLAAGDHIVMATDASALNLRMVDARCCHRHPGGGKFLVASFTIIRRRHMVTALATGKYGVMADNTTIDELRMTDTRDAGPSRGSMTVATILSGGEMIDGFAHGDDAVMATAAKTANFTVIHIECGNGRPTDKIHMAGFATVRRGHVVGGSRRCPDPQRVAAYTVAVDSLMDEFRGTPTTGVMAGITFLVADDVIQRLGFCVHSGGCGHALDSVAGTATASEHLGMIHGKRRHPGLSGVAGITAIAGWRMRRGLAFGDSAIMAVIADAENFLMLHLRHRQPNIGSVADSAVVGRGNMPAMLTSRNLTIVAGHARPQHPCMVHGQRRFPQHGGMTGIASRCTVDMGGGFAAGDGAVMTEYTFLAVSAVIHVRRKVETLGTVTNLALLLGCNVTHGFATGQHAIMAAIAGFRSAAKHAVDMAGFAFGKNMLPDQREAGVEVIECLGAAAARRTMNDGQV